MAKLRPHQTAFTSGEVSPRLRGRLDTDRYHNGAAVMQNFRVHSHGGASKRPGTHYVANTRLDAPAALVSFKFSTVQAYILEFSDLTLRFYMDGYQIETAPGVPYEIVTPYAAADVGDLQVAQTADTMIITHTGYKPRVLTRTGHTAWTLSNYTPPSYVITAATKANPVVLTITANGISRGNLFNVASVGGMTQINGRTFRAGEVIGNNVPLLDSETGDPIDGTAYGAYTTGGTAGPVDLFNAAGDYPKSVTFDHQRVVFGFPGNNPNMIYGSRIGDYFNMQPGINDADGYQFGLTSGSGRVPSGQWLAGTDVLLIGGAGAEFTATGGSSLPITPTNIDLKEQSFNGSKAVQPAIVEKRAIFSQRAGKKVRDMEYQSLQASGGYQSSNVSIISEHITRKGVTRFAFQAVPDPIVWAVRADGQLLGFTYDTEQSVFAWYRYVMGGTDAVVESVATIPSAEGEQTWVIVSRTVNGSAVRHVEYFDEETWRDSLPTDPGEADILAVQPDCFYVDCGLSYEGAATDTITGLDHLEGETVSVLANGAVHPPVVVSSGTITLQYLATKVHAGLGYGAQLKTLPIGDIGALGSSIGRTMSWAELYVLLDLSGGGYVASEELIYRRGTTLGNNPPALFSGVKKADDHAAEDGSINITHDTPLPFTVLAVSGQLQVNE